MLYARVVDHAGNARRRLMVQVDQQVSTAAHHAAPSAHVQVDQQVSTAAHHAAPSAHVQRVHDEYSIGIGGAAGLAGFLMSRLDTIQWSVRPRVRGAVHERVWSRVVDPQTINGVIFETAPEGAMAFIGFTGSEDDPTMWLDFENAPRVGAGRGAKA